MKLILQYLTSSLQNCQSTKGCGPSWTPTTRARFSLSPTTRGSRGWVDDDDGGGDDDDCDGDGGDDDVDDDDGAGDDGYCFRYDLNISNCKISYS